MWHGEKRGGGGGGGDPLTFARPGMWRAQVPEAADPLSLFCFANKSGAGAQVCPPAPLTPVRSRSPPATCVQRLPLASVEHAGARPGSRVTDAWRAQTGLHRQGRAGGQAG